MLFQFVGHFLHLKLDCLQFLHADRVWHHLFHWLVAAALDHEQLDVSLHVGVLLEHCLNGGIQLLYQGMALDHVCDVRIQFTGGHTLINTFRHVVELVLDGHQVSALEVIFMALDQGLHCANFLL